MPPVRLVSKLAFQRIIWHSIPELPTLEAGTDLGSDPGGVTVVGETNIVGLTSPFVNQDFDMFGAVCHFRARNYQFGM